VSLSIQYSAASSRFWFFVLNMISIVFGDAHIARAFADPFEEICQQRKNRRRPRPINGSTS
jgi:hypothetical protein